MEMHRLVDGTEILLRPIDPGDEPLIEELHERHSEHTIRLRFFALVRHLSRGQLMRLCHLDPSREAGLAALYHDAQGQLHMIGVARYYLHHETGEAEFAVVVTDTWQNRGVGGHLMRQLAEFAQRAGAKRLVGDVLRENTAMLRLMLGLGYTIRPTDDPAVVQAVRELAPAAG